MNTNDAEKQRLQEDLQRLKNWKRWGPYLSERQWGTVREDYSPDGSCWSYFTHDMARSRTYRWGEDGLLGITDRQCRLCFSLALWNERDPILKERLFGLTGPEGNNGEDVKECYYYLDSAPTHSYMRALYKYPQNEFPYARLIDENKRRGRGQPEFELSDTGIFDNNEYFDVFAEYAKSSPNDILIRIEVHNRAAVAAPIHLLPTLWYRNSWSWGRTGEGYTTKPRISREKDNCVRAEHSTLETMYMAAAASSSGVKAELLFTDNETNNLRLYGTPNTTEFAKDAFHEYVVSKRADAVSPAGEGTKVAWRYRVMVPANSSETITLRLSSEAERPKTAFGKAFEELVATRREENETHYRALAPANATEAEHQVLKQAYAGLLWSKQFYYYAVREWTEGDPTQPTPAPTRDRNREWQHLYNRDIISMPDKWEYPWYAAWDLAFHMITFARLDPDFAKRQLILMLREWYMHPNGQIPAYEFAFSDVNPPVHAWACWRVYKMTGERGKRDRSFLARVFQKLLLNFTWWVNRKDETGKNLFSGGFLGLDNIGVFDRGAPLPVGGSLEQADGTAWMAFYCATMLSMAVELASEDMAYGDIASKFFEHFVAITDAMNRHGGTGLWDQLDGFYYDRLSVDGHEIPLRVRSLVGILPLIACEVLEDRLIEKLRGFKKRMGWFLDHRPDLAQQLPYLKHSSGETGHRLLAVPSRERLARMLRHILDESEFLSQYGVRSLSRVHASYPYVFKVGSEEYRVEYNPDVSKTLFFGGNSNWRGPIWFPINYLVIEALERYHHFYGDDFKVECPTGSGNMLNLREVSQVLSERMANLFIPDANGKRACHGDEKRYAQDPAWKDLVLFYEFFNGDTGHGLGASHQTGWTALVTRCIEKRCAARSGVSEET